MFKMQYDSIRLIEMMNEINKKNNEKNNDELLALKSQPGVITAIQRFGKEYSQIFEAQIKAIKMPYQPIMSEIELEKIRNQVKDSTCLSSFSEKNGLFNLTQNGYFSRALTTFDVNDRKKLLTM